MILLPNPSQTHALNIVFCWNHASIYLCFQTLILPEVGKSGKDEGSSVKIETEVNNQHGGRKDNTIILTNG
jgi:hypothetical protein